jgi:hypothetical protein
MLNYLQEWCIVIQKHKTVKKYYERFTAKAIRLTIDLQQKIDKVYKEIKVASQG